MSQINHKFKVIPMSLRLMDLKKEKLKIKEEISVIVVDAEEETCFTEKHWKAWM